MSVHRVRSSNYRVPSGRKRCSTNRLRSAATHAYKKYDLKPGETLTTSCSFNNTNDFGVPFGESTDAEMCYQFIFAWPAHASSNLAPSILGVTDTCW